MSILQRGMKSVKKKIWLILIFVLAILGAWSCGGKMNQNTKSPEKLGDEEKDYIVIGFSQLGAESDWRSANTESMKSTFTEEKGYKLIFSDGQQRQANQIKAIRTFIQQEVDYIILAPVTETGWDTVLQEAKDAGIPVIIVDRKVDVADESLFECWVGSNFELEGMKATEWINRYTRVKNITPEDIHIVAIQGDIGSSAQIGRTKALEDAANKYGWDLLAEVTGDFNQAKGREVMKSFIKKYPNLNVVYCENDNEALGALEAIRDAGKKAGPNINNGEIMVVSFDGVSQEALSYAIYNKISCIAECNPLHGPRVEAIIETLERGETPEKYSYVEGAIYCADDTVKTISVNGVEYETTVPILEERSK